MHTPIKQYLVEIGNIIFSQQEYASHNFLSKKLLLDNIIEDALNIQADPLTKANILIEKHFTDIHPVVAQKSKLIHVIINLVENAIEAMRHNATKNKKLIINTGNTENYVYLRLTDTGCGIEKKLLEKIFTRSYTTKDDGFGFGLHDSANYINDMGGTMWAESNGKDQGSTFIIHLPHAQ